MNIITINAAGILRLFMSGVSIELLADVIEPPGIAAVEAMLREAIERRMRREGAEEVHMEGIPMEIKIPNTIPKFRMWNLGS